MEESEIKIRARNQALKILASYIASIAALIFGVLSILIAAQEMGVDKDVIQKINMGTPVIAIGLSLLIHFLSKHDLRKAFTTYITILFLTIVVTLGVKIL